jgi:hypothetical protein
VIDNATGRDAGGVRGAASVGGCRGDVRRSVGRECHTGNGSPARRAVTRSVASGDADGGAGGPPRGSPCDGSETLARAHAGAVGLLFARGYQAVHRFSRTALKWGKTGEIM